MSIAVTHYLKQAHSFLSGDAADYYVDTSAANDSGDGSINDPKKYIRSGLALMSASGGDILEIADGTYSNALDYFSDGIGNNYMTKGTAINWNKIRAASIGGVRITQVFDLKDDSNQYIEFNGLHFDSGTSASRFAAHYMKWFNCGFKGGVLTSNNNGVSLGTNDFDIGFSYFLFEDCWFYGIGGRYKINAFQGNYSIMRRCIFRHDGGWSSIIKGDPVGILSIYNTRWFRLQNCICVDNDQILDINVSRHSEGCFFIHTNLSSGGTAGTIHTDYGKVQGCINVNSILPNDRFNRHLKFAAPSMFNDMLVEDFFGIDCLGQGMQTQKDYQAGCHIDLNRVVLMNQSTDGIAIFGSNGANFTLNIKNSIINNCVKGINSGISGDTINKTYNVYYDYASDGPSGTGEETYNPETNGMLYPTRIEDGSTLKTDGESGGQVGPTILKRRGASGTLFNDPGFDDLTTDDLWPFPNEDLIKTDLSAVSTRGFCSGNSIDGNPQTLTKYIWEYLGNEIPVGIY